MDQFYITLSTFILLKSVASITFYTEKMSTNITEIVIDPTPIKEFASQLSHASLAQDEDSVPTAWMNSITTAQKVKKYYGLAVETLLFLFMF